LKPEKCKFKKQQTEYLGHIISPGKVEMDPTKLDGIKLWPIPKSTQDVQKFIGFTNYYRKFIYHYANITQPLNILLSKNVSFQWSNEVNKAFEKLKV
jgi:hypothetical protein